MEEIVYQRFKTVMEMFYVLEKLKNRSIKISENKKQEFNQRFAQNMLQCRQSKRFCKEYADYEEALARKKQLRIKPQNKRDMHLYKILKELEAIKIACQPYQLDNKEIWRKQADTRLKYEKRLRNNMFESKLITKNNKEK